MAAPSVFTIHAPFFVVPTGSVIARHSCSRVNRVFLRMCSRCHLQLPPQYRLPRSFNVLATRHRFPRSCPPEVFINFRNGNSIFSFSCFLVTREESSGFLFRNGAARGYRSMIAGHPRCAPQRAFIAAKIEEEHSGRADVFDSELICPRSWIFECSGKTLRSPLSPSPRVSSAGR